MTVTVPLWGRLSDLYGRRYFYILGVSLFLAGSVMSGLSQSMLELIRWRALQGIGAGALYPIGMTIVGDIYSLERRAKIQGYFSGVWGLSSLAGPLVGGLVTDHLSWRWVFFLNIPFGTPPDSSSEPKPPRPDSPVQNRFPRNRLGIATSGNLFFRSVGGAIGIAVMGSVFSRQISTRFLNLGSNLHSAQLERFVAHPDSIVDPAARALIPPELLRQLQEALGDSLQAVFLVGFIISVLAFASALLVPAGSVREHARREE